MSGGNNWQDSLRRIAPDLIPQHVDMSQLWRVELCAHLALVAVFIMAAWAGAYFGIFGLEGETAGFRGLWRQVIADPSGLFDLLVVIFWTEVVVQSYVFSYLRFLEGTLAFWKIIGMSALPLFGALIYFAMGISTTEGFWFMAFGVLALCLFGMMFLGPLILHFLYRLISNNEDLSDL